LRLTSVWIDSVLSTTFAISSPLLLVWPELRRCDTLAFDLNLLYRLEVGES